MLKQTLRACPFEAFGTFVLILAICTPIDNAPPGVPAVIAKNIAVVLTLAVYLCAPFSGSHFNPIVTLFLAAMRSFPVAAVLPYIAAQFVGGFLAVLMAFGDFGKGPGTRDLALVTSTHPHAGLVSALGMAAFLCIVYFATAHEDAVPTLSGLLVGGGLSLIVLVTAPITGAGYNPVREVVPMVLTGVYSWYPLNWELLLGLPIAMAICLALSGAKKPSDLM